MATLEKFKIKTKDIDKFDPDHDTHTYINLENYIKNLVNHMEKFIDPNEYFCCDNVDNALDQLADRLDIVDKDKFRKEFYCDLGQEPQQNLTQADVDFLVTLTGKKGKRYTLEFLRESL